MERKHIEFLSVPEPKFDTLQQFLMGFYGVSILYRVGAEEAHLAHNQGDD
jgi:hypothetical protein